MGRLARAGLYAGALIGPFGGAITTSILPEIGASFGRSAGSAASTLTFYLVPFAVLMLVSGTFAQRWGPQRTVRIAYIAYAVTSALAASAWTFEVLLAARALQGAANSFTTPVLLAVIAASTPKEKLGRALGLFGSTQAAGQTSAPLVGGLTAEIDWRLAFVVISVVAVGLAVLGVPQTDAEPERNASLRSAFVPSTIRPAVVAFVGWGCLGGLSFLVAFRLDDVFGLGAGERGLLLTGFGIVGFLTARQVGKAIDRFGAATTVVVGATLGAGLIAAAGTTPVVAIVVLAWALTGAAAQGVLVSINALVLQSENANRGGSVSVVQSLRFMGAAAAPLAFVPLYQAHPLLGFLVPAGLLITVPAVVTWSGRGAGTRRTPQPEAPPPLR
ncbi:putative MFS family arabinose efflux permease [Lentzea atacamensis]|uniref:MFS family arabinose efflux permease n=2 Tax=Lentzea TaxID=165301 RepID=A0A316I6U5_9PSEU|nr:putative MFS family arabinose efflux permease [Lentzea atacamensis]RAS62430.1 putative MFS family arabinose efflux permease [Lentzea atacamensis]